MKKLLPTFASALFGLFVIGVGGAVLFYSFNGLGLIFPNDLLGQSFGMMLFDLAMFVWFLVFISKCESTMQYIFASFGFLIGLGGTLGLVGIEVGLSSGMLEAGSMQKPLTYIFIAVLIGHLILIYAHHAAAPGLSADISLGIEKAKITDQAMKQAEQLLMDQQKLLASGIAGELVTRVLHDLNLDATGKQIIDLPALDVVQDESHKAEGGAPNFLWGLFNQVGKGERKFGMNVPSVAMDLKAQTRKPSPAATDAESADQDGAKLNV